MDEILKSFSLGILLRSVLSGAFFLLSVGVATHDSEVASLLPDLTKEGGLTLGLAFALVAGITVYGIHRSLIYPLFEWLFNANWAKKLRENWWTLISQNSIDKLEAKWRERSESASDHMTVWADYIHLQFSSVWCVAFGALTGNIMSGWKLVWCFPLIGLMIILFLAACISNWRLHSVEQYRESPFLFGSSNWWLRMWGWVGRKTGLA